MTREEFEAALQTVYDDDGYHEETDVQRLALLAHDAEQREEIARLRLEQSTAPWGIARVAALKAEIERLREMRDRLAAGLGCWWGTWNSRRDGMVVTGASLMSDTHALIDEWRAAKAEEAKREEAPRMGRS
jgi:hypothetical protein